MAIIQSGASPQLWTIDPISEAGRVTLYGIDGNPLMGVDTISLLNVTLDSLNETATLNLTGQANCSFQAFGSSGVWTVTFQATIDGTNWFSVNATTLGGSSVSTTTGDGVWFLNTSGYQGVRAKMTAFTSGQTQMGMIATPEEHSIATSGATNVNITGTGGIALDTTLDNLTITPGASLGANTLAMMGGSVTTASPSYTNGTINALSLTTAGALRVDGSAVTQPVSGTVIANAGTGNFNVIGTGTAGTAATGVVTIQGIAGGVAIPVSGTVTATSPSVSTTGTAPPGSATYIGGSVTTAAPSYTTGQMNALSLTTGGLLRVDGSSVTQPISAASLPLPTGAATESTLTGVLTTTAFQARINTLGQKTMANSTPVVLSSDQSAIPITDNGGSLTIDNPALSVIGGGTEATALRVTIANDSTGVLSIDDNGSSLTVDGTVSISGTVTTQDTTSLVDNAGFTDGTSRVMPVGFIFDETAGTALTENDVAAARLDSKRAQVITIEDATTRGQRLTITAANAMKIDGSAVTQPISAVSLPLPTGAATETTLGGVLTTTAFQARINTLGQKTMANSTPVVLASDQTAIPVSQSGTWTVTSNIGTTNGLALDATLSAQSLVDNAAFTDGTSRVVPSGHIFDETAGTALTENDVAASRIDSKRAQIGVLEDGTTRGTRNTIKAASTAAVATDTALVVAISPNNTIVTSNAAVSATGSAPPASATYMGGSVTTAAPTYTNATMNALSLTTSGLLRIDGSGVTQPISAASLPLPVGAATETTLGGILTTTAFQARINTLGQKTMANSTPVVLASDQSAIPVSQSGTWTVQPGNTANTTPWLTTINQGGNSATVTASNALKVDGSAVTQPVSGTVTANAGTGTFTVGQATAANLNATIVGTGTDNTANSTTKVPVLPARANTSAPAWTDGNMVPLSTDTAGALRVTGSVTSNKATTGTITSVAGSTSNTSILASNTSRVSATVYNDSNKTMYLALSAAASTSSYTIQIARDSYWELPVVYTGAISAVWASGVSGNALITEIT